VEITQENISMIYGGNGGLLRVSVVDED